MGFTKTLFVRGMAFLAFLASCGEVPQWEDREVLRDLQDAPGTPAAPAACEIGVVLPLSGRLASYGTAVRAGLNLAVDEFGEERLRLVVLDSKGTAEGTAVAVKTLTLRSSVLAVVGPCTSSNARVAAEVAQSAGVTLITPSASAFDVTRDRRFVFRTCFTDPLQAAAMAIFARTTLGQDSVGFVVVRDDAYSRSLADAFEKAFSAMGGDIAFLDWFGEGLDAAAPARALALRPAPPDAVFVPAYDEESARLVIEARKGGYGGVFLGGDGWHSDALMSIGGKALRGSYFTTHFIADDPAPAAAKFLHLFRERNKKEPGPFSALGYDTGLAVIHALGAMKGVSREAFRASFAAIEDLEGATGTITMDEAGNTIKDAVIAEIGEDGPKFRARIRFTPRFR